MIRENNMQGVSSSNISDEAKLESLSSDVSDSLRKKKSQILTQT